MARITIKFFATIREVVGTKSIEIEVDTIEDMLHKLKKQFGRPFIDTAIDLETGELKRFFSCMINGKRIELLDGYLTKLEDNDTVALFPPVGGG
ncbi:MAG: ubiquitin-like small modifier protein 1 [Candidatus Thorarchaeota archaeon]